MANFCIRLQLHQAVGDDYTRLHAAMERAGFKRTIQDDNGVRWKLPWGEYRLEGQASGSIAVRGRVQSVASTIGKPFWVLVTEEVGSAWSGLVEA